MIFCNRPRPDDVLNFHLSGVSSRLLHSPSKIGLTFSLKGCDEMATFPASIIFNVELFRRNTASFPRSAFGRNSVSVGWTNFQCFTHSVRYPKLYLKTRRSILATQKTGSETRSLRVSDLITLLCGPAALLWQRRRVGWASGSSERLPQTIVVINRRIPHDIPVATLRS